MMRRIITLLCSRFQTVSALCIDRETKGRRSLYAWVRCTNIGWFIWTGPPFWESYLRRKVVGRLPAHRQKIVP